MQVTIVTRGSSLRRRRMGDPAHRADHAVAGQIAQKLRASELASREFGLVAPTCFQAIQMSPNRAADPNVTKAVI